MSKTKPNSLASIPKDQRCHFMIGPVSSWFMPNTSDIWSQPRGQRSEQVVNASHLGGDACQPSEESEDDQFMDCVQTLDKEPETSLSYFIHGCIGCFCYGEIHHHAVLSQQHPRNNHPDQLPSLSATVKRMVDVKDDNSRVSCVRFLKNSLYPLAMILTESGSFLIHDCLTGENLVRFKRSELIAKLVEPFTSNSGDSSTEHCNKRARMNVTQQVTSCVWPNSTNAFVGVSLLKEKTNLLFRLKLKDITKLRHTPKQINKPDFLVSCEKLELNLPQYASPICCMESSLLDDQNCLIAVAMDDGLINVIKFNFQQGQAKRVIKLARDRSDQICSLSFYTGNRKKFPLGLLASAFRNGLVLVWDVENEFYFADHWCTSDSDGGAGRSGPKINWFSLVFVATKNSDKVHLVVSNTDSGLSALEIPENIRSKIRLKEEKDGRQKKRQGGNSNQSTRHHALVFNVVFDQITETLMTSSLDGNYILWSCKERTLDSNTMGDKKEAKLLEIQSQYLLPTMPNNSRTHMLRHSPIREDLVGLALGKAGVRFYHITDSSQTSQFHMDPSCSLISRKITKASLNPTSIAWHPRHEYRAAIGTIEGRVLRVDLTPRKATMIEAEHLPLRQSKQTLARDCEEDPFDVEYQPIERDNHDRQGQDGSAGLGQSASDRKPKNDGVYSLCWGPNPTSPQDVTRMAIYATGSISGRLFIYHNRKETSDKLTNYLDEVNDRSLPEAVGEASEVSWRSSMDLMALGTTSGRVIIVGYRHVPCGIEGGAHDGGNGNKSIAQQTSFDSLFVRLAIIEGPLGSSRVQCLAWHPSCDRNDEHYGWLAASANESPVYVFDIQASVLASEIGAKLRIAEDGEQRNDQQQLLMLQHRQQQTDHDGPAFVSNFVYKLEAHTKAITDVAWNPHDANQVATASFDRFCYVWTLPESGSGQQKEPQISARFAARDRLFTMDWSLVDTDLIYTSGSDSIVWAWRPSENASTGLVGASKNSDSHE